MNGWTRADVVAGALVLAAMVGVLVLPPAYGFVGWDTYPILAAAKIESWADLRGVFTESLTADYFPFGFYRPLYSLSMALDYAVWGLEPFGFRLSNALLFGAAALALYRLTGALLGHQARLGPLVALFTVLVFPFHDQLAAGPFANRSDLLCGLFVVVALAWESRRMGSDGRWRHLGPACVTVLAQASKETGIILPPLVAALVLLGERIPAGRRARRACTAMAWHLAAVALVVAARTFVLGGMAGHASTSVAAMGERLPAVLGRLVLALVAQRPAFEPSTAADSAAALAFGMVFVWGAMACVRSSARDDTPSRAVRAGVFGASMILAAAGVYALVGWVAPWYLFVPSLGLAIVCGAAAEAALASIRIRHGWGVLSRAVLVVLASWVAWQAAASPFARRDPTWAEWTAASDTFLAGLEARLDASAPGSVVTIPYPGRILQPYSVQAWADLTRGAGRVRVVTKRDASTTRGAETTVVLVGEASWHE
jgi:hypothetical protein